MDRVAPSEGIRRRDNPLIERLHRLAHAPTIAPSATYANICGEAERELRAASKALKTLICAIEGEGYDVMVDIDGTHSVRLREQEG